MNNRLKTQSQLDFNQSAFEIDHLTYFRTMKSSEFPHPGERVQPARAQREQLHLGTEHGPDEPPQQRQLQCAPYKVGDSDGDSDCYGGNIPKHTNPKLEGERQNFGGGGVQL